MERMQRLAPHTTVVNTLRQYGKVKVDFLAHVLGRSREEVDEVVRGLMQDGIVVVEGDEVALAERKTGRGAVAGG